MQNEAKQTDMCTKGPLNVTLTKYGFVCFLICLGFSGLTNVPDEHNGGIGVAGLIKAKKQFYSSRCYWFTQNNE